MLHANPTDFAIALFLATNGATVIPLGVRAYDAATMAGVDMLRSVGVNVRLPRSDRSRLPRHYHARNRYALANA